MRLPLRHERVRTVVVTGASGGVGIANAVVPGLLDRYLGRTGYGSQQTETDEAPAAPAHGNLWEPADGAAGRHHGAHGRFDARAHAVSPQAWLSRYRAPLLAAATAAAPDPGARPPAPGWGLGPGGPRRAPGEGARPPAVPLPPTRERAPGAP